MTGWILPLFALLVGNLAAMNADACGCLSQPIEKDFTVADSVFLGKITQISELYSETRSPSPDSATSTQQATFEVSEIFKGPLVESVDFEAIFPVSDGTCGYPFYVGGTYLVWAKGDRFSGYKASAGSDFIGICGRTGSADDKYVQDELKWLRSR